MDHILQHPAVPLLFVLASFAGFSALQKRFKNHAFFNPVIWSILSSVVLIKLSGISYQSYMEGAFPIHFLLGPATVALAVPLYRLLKNIKLDAKAIFVAIGFSSVFSAFSAMGVLIAMSASKDLQLAITSKSVTAPIAIEIAQKLGTPESLAILFVFATNIPWLLFTGLAFKVFRIHDERAQGLALGTTCHGLGAARAFQISEVAGTYSVIGMSLMGIISGLLLPILMIILFK
tara:strand:+ start:164 stop:862 length:699 start_codon:yes stop_codon:yes gene_type:complete